MVEEGKPQESEKKSEADVMFEAEVGLMFVEKRGSGDDKEKTDDDSDNHGDISDVIEHSRKKSDIQIVIEKMFPQFPVKWLDILMVSRVFPDAFNHMLSLCVKELLRTTKMTMGEAIAYVEAVLTIAIDGEGRIDGIHIIKGGASESDDSKNKIGMGIG
jgi:hypothetical protein